jgi:hypothetical protein
VNSSVANGIVALSARYGEGRSLHRQPNKRSADCECRVNTEPLDVLPPLGFLLIAVALSLLTLEGGYQLGKWRHAHVAEEKAAPVGAMVASILALLAFMLAFTFGMAASRFDARRQVLLDEANAIGTAYLRARLLPEPERSETARMLREYVDVRVRGIEQQDVAQASSRSAELHKQLWSQATTAAAKTPGSIMTGLFIQSLNDVIDLHAKRLFAGGSRIPLPIWMTLFVLGLLGMSSTGYQAGLSTTRRTPAMLILALAFSSVLFLIVDLDRAHEGFLQVRQDVMLDLQKSMKSAQQ